MKKLALNTGISAVLALTASAQTITDLRLVDQGNVLWTASTGATLDLMLTGNLEGTFFVHSNSYNGSEYEVGDLGMYMRTLNEFGVSPRWTAVDDEYYPFDGPQKVTVTDFDPASGLIEAEFSIPIGGYTEDDYIRPRFLYLDNTLELSVGWHDDLRVDDSNTVQEAFATLTTSFDGDVFEPYIMHMDPGQDLSVGEPTRFVGQFQTLPTADEVYTISVSPANAVLLPGEQESNGVIVRPTGGSTVQRPSQSGIVSFEVTPRFEGEFRITISGPAGSDIRSHVYEAGGSVAPMEKPATLDNDDAGTADATAPGGGGKGGSGGKEPGNEPPTISYYEYSLNEVCEGRNVGWSGGAGGFPETRNGACGPCIKTPNMPNPIACIGGGSPFLPGQSAKCRWTWNPFGGPCIIDNSKLKQYGYTGKSVLRACGSSTDNGGFGLHGSIKGKILWGGAEGEIGGGINTGGTSTTRLENAHCCEYTRSPGKFNWKLGKCR